MPVAREPDAGTAVLPGPPDAGWQARVAMMEITARLRPGRAARFAVRAGTLELTGSQVEHLWVRADGPPGPAAGTAVLRCASGPGRGRLTGELDLDGLASAVSLRVRVLDADADRVLLWLAGPVRPATPRVLPAFSRIQLAAEFTR